MEEIPPPSIQPDVNQVPVKPINSEQGERNSKIVKLMLMSVVFIILIPFVIIFSSWGLRAIHVNIDPIWLIIIFCCVFAAIAVYKIIDNTVVPQKGVLNKKAPSAFVVILFALLFFVAIVSKLSNKP